MFFRRIIFFYLSFKNKMVNFLNSFILFIEKSMLFMNEINLYSNTVFLSFMCRYRYRPVTVIVSSFRYRDSQTTIRNCIGVTLII